MHRVLTLSHRGRVEVELYAKAAMEYKGVRRSSVNLEIARLDSGRIHWIAQVNCKGSRRIANNQAAARRIGGGHRKPYQIPVGEGILLRLAVDSHAPIRPRSDMLNAYCRA